MSTLVINSTSKAADALAAEKPVVVTTILQFIDISEWCHFIKSTSQSTISFSLKGILLFVCRLLSGWQLKVEKLAADIEMEKNRALTIIGVIKAVTFISIAADITQEVFESTSYNVVGKILSALANITYGITVGFAVYGLEGALVGSVLGLLLWGGLEAIRYLLS